MAISPRTTESIKQGGGRHYRGRGLGAEKPWKCVACDGENAGPLKDGCANCGAGKPGQQVQQPPRPAAQAATGGAELVRGTAVQASPPPPVRRAVPGGLRIPRAVDVDYDEIERRVASVLERRLGGGYSDQERATLYAALEVYVNAWEDGLIEPSVGLNLEKTRELALRVAPDDMPEIEPAERPEAEDHARTTETATETSSAPRYDNDGPGGAGEPGGPEPGGAFDPDATADGFGDDGPDVEQDGGAGPGPIVQRKPTQ